MSQAKLYPAIRNILSSLFSVQTGLDDEAARTAYQRAFAADLKLRTEVARLFQDENVDWCELLCNSDYEVCETGSNEEARTIARELFARNVID